MADLMKSLEKQGKREFFEAQIADLSDFIKDIEEYTHIEICEGELDSLKTYIEECGKRLQSISECIKDYEERKENND